MQRNRCGGFFVGLGNGKGHCFGQLHFHDMRDFDRMIDSEYQRPKDQWWLELKGIASLLAQQGPKIDGSKM